MFLTLEPTTQYQLRPLSVQLLPVGNYHWSTGLGGRVARRLTQVLFCRVAHRLQSLHPERRAALLPGAPMASGGTPTLTAVPRIARSVGYDPTASR